MFESRFNGATKEAKSACWFLFNDRKLLIKKENKDLFIPQSPDLDRLNLALGEKLYLGSLDGRPCYTSELSGSPKIPDDFSFHGLRSLFSRIDHELVWAGGLGNQLVLWSKNHQYCGRCGDSTENKEDERAKVCPGCGLTNYPRLSPAIIVAVIKQNQILLAHAERFPAKFYSVLAGFVEPGENLEECIHREVGEEVGIEVKNIRYFGSQPWPFPVSLMIAFTAEYAGGEIEIDHSEIQDAGWFSADNLPPIPPSISIARKLIDWFLDNQA